MTFRHFAVIRACVLFGLVSVPALNAQRLADLPAGTMVRLEMNNDDVYSGPLLKAGADSVRISSGANTAPVVLPSSNIRGYQIGFGKDRGRGAWNGTRIGAGFGLLTLALMKSLGGSEGRKQMKFGYAIAITSSVLGVSLGTALAPERWRPAQP